MHMDMRSVLVGFLSVTRGQRCAGIPITNEIRLGNLTQPWNITIASLTYHRTKYAMVSSSQTARNDRKVTFFLTCYPYIYIYPYYIYTHYIPIIYPLSISISIAISICIYIYHRYVQIQIMGTYIYISNTFPLASGSAWTMVYQFLRIGKASPAARPRRQLLGRIRPLVQRDVVIANGCEWFILTTGYVMN